MVGQDQGQLEGNKGFSALLSQAAESARDGETLRVIHVILHMAQVLGFFPAWGSMSIPGQWSGLASVACGLPQIQAWPPSLCAHRHRPSISAIAKQTRLRSQEV